MQTLDNLLLDIKLNFTAWLESLRDTPVEYLVLANIVLALAVLLLFFLRSPGRAITVQRGASAERIDLVSVRLHDRLAELDTRVTNLTQELQTLQANSKTEDTTEDKTQKAPYFESETTTTTNYIPTQELLKPEPMSIEPASLFGRLLAKTRTALTDKITAVFSATNATKTTAALEEELEAALISADMGTQAVGTLLSELRPELPTLSPDKARALIKLKLVNMLGASSRHPTFITREGRPTVIMLVGVNGAGKTTTAAKLAYYLGGDGEAKKRVLLVAADTFRAAAVEQLLSWGEKLGIPVLTGKEGSKPSAVVYDGIKKAIEEQFDYIIIDTAGRLQNKANLMAELTGIDNAIRKQLPSGADEVLLVLDGGCGQNGLIQAKVFNEAVKLTGTIVTKLDGSSKGGIVVAIKNELDIPVRFVGLGEGVEQFAVFNPGEFVDEMV